MILFKRAATLFFMATVAVGILCPITSAQDKDDFYVAVEQMPQLHGSLDSLYRQIEFPELARKAGIQGRVMVEFIVNKKGNVEYPSVMRGLGGGCDEEALRVVKKAHFTPGKQQGKPVRVKYSLPVRFDPSEHPQQEDSQQKQADMPPPPKDQSEIFFISVEQMPQLKGGLAQLQQKVEYPKAAQKAKVEGTVVVQFIVNKQGKVENPEILRGIGKGCDQEAKRVIKQARFEPGRQRGKAVRVQYSLPIRFRLQN